MISTSSTSTSSNPQDRESDVFYTTGDEKEDKRLRDLHGIAREFYQMQKNYVELLENVSQARRNFALNAYSDKTL